MTDTTWRTCATCNEPAEPLRAHCEACHEHHYRSNNTSWVGEFMADPKEPARLERLANTPITIRRIDRE